MHATITNNADTVCAAQIKDVRCKATFTNYHDLAERCRSTGATDLNIIGLEDRGVLLGMRLGFCDAVPPLVFLFRDNYTSVNGTGNCSLWTTQRVRTVSCSDVVDLEEGDAELREFHEAYVDILQRHEFSLERDAKNETDETEKCKVSEC